MMSYTTEKTKAYFKHAEIFTPPSTVFYMVLHNEVRSLLQDVDKTAFDPAVGHGQFPCAVLVLKIFFNIERLDEDLALRALRSLYGMDIQAASVDKARDHLIQTLQDAFKYFTGKDFSRLDEVRAIVETNIMHGDNIAYMKRLTEPQLSLF